MTTTKTKPVQSATDRTLTIRRVFDAPREKVFKAWTEPEHMIHWWGPKEFTCPVCKIDFCVGGSYLNCMRSPDGQDYWSQGVYDEIAVPERIVCTDTFADEQGRPVSPQHYGMSDDWPTEAQVAVTFAEHGGKTMLTVEHSPIPPGRERDMCRQGWNESLDKLADYLRT